MKQKTCRNFCRNLGGMAHDGAGLTRLAKKSLAPLALLALTCVGLMLAGCGGGSGAISSQVVSGTAAVGAPLSGQVSLKDSSTPSLQKTAVIGSDGSFAVDVTGMKAPYVLQAKGSAGGTQYKLNSYAEATGTANINPLSDVIVASAAGVDNPSDAFDKADEAHNRQIGARMENSVALIMSTLQPLLKQYSAEHTNPITSSYIANHLGLDDLFDNVKITVSGGILSIINTKTQAVIFAGKVSDIAHGVFNNGALPPALSAPATPANLSAVAGTNQVTLTWSAVSTATSYNVYYATSSGVGTGNGTKIGSATSPAVQTGLSAGTTYYYIVTALNSTGESAPSVQVAAATLPALPSPTAPASPAGVTATGGANQVTVSWPAVSGAASYNVFWSTAAGLTTTSATKVAGVTSPFVKSGLAAGTTYYFIVTAVNSVGESAASAAVPAATAAPAPTLPAAPVGVMATGAAQQVSISWSPVSGTTSYNLYWSTAPGVTTASGTKIAGATSPQVQTGLSAGTTYYYIVTAVNAFGEGPASAAVSAATSAPAPAPVPAFDALAYYNSVCLGCHGSLGVRSATQISSAISTVGAMKSLSTLTAAQISAIAAVSY